MSKAINIIIADSQYLIRLGLKHLLSKQENWQVTAEVESMPELLEVLDSQAQQTNVIILDHAQVKDFTPDHLKAIKEKSNEAQLLIISSDEQSDRIYQVIESGINGFLTKQCDEDEIRTAVKALAKGEKFFCHKIIDMILHKHIHGLEEPTIDDEASCAPSSLTKREIEVVKLVSQGYSTKAIAEQLFLSPYTVSTHRKNILKKLGITSVSELTLYAVRTGLISAEEEG